MIYSNKEKDKQCKITDQLIQTVAEFKQELYNRLDRIRQLEQTRKEVVNYFGRARITIKRINK